TCLFIFLLHDHAPPDLHSLSLHDALPIYRRSGRGPVRAPPGAPAAPAGRCRPGSTPPTPPRPSGSEYRRGRTPTPPVTRYHEPRSEEHTSELQSPDHLVCRLLLEKKTPSA